MENLEQAVETPVDETTTQPAVAEETNAETSESEENASKQTTEDSEEYYKKQLEKAEKAIVKLKKKQKETPQEEDKHPAEDIRSVIREELNQFKAELSRKEKEEHLSKVTKGDNQRKIVEHYLENVIRSTGDYKQDVELALALADKDKYQREAQTLKDAVVSQNTAGGPEFSGHKRPKPGKENWSAADKELLKKYGALK